MTSTAPAFINLRIFQCIFWTSPSPYSKKAGRKL